MRCSSSRCLRTIPAKDVGCDPTTGSVRRLTALGDRMTVNCHAMTEAGPAYLTAVVLWLAGVVAVIARKLAA